MSYNVSPVPLLQYINAVNAIPANRIDVTSTQTALSDVYTDANFDTSQLYQQLTDYMTASTYNFAALNTLADNYRSSATVVDFACVAC